MDNKQVNAVSTRSKEDWLHQVATFNHQLSQGYSANNQITSYKLNGPIIGHKLDGRFDGLLVTNWRLKTLIVKVNRRSF